MHEISGYILAGGSSTRMGRPKQRLTLGGKELLEIAYDNLSRLCQQVSVVVKEEIAGSPYRQICDDAPGITEADGPLIGIYTALLDTETEWNFILACDLPFVTPELVDLLASNISDTSDAVIPVQTDGKTQPLCGLYRRSACVEVAERSLKLGKRSPMAVLDQVSTLFIDFSGTNSLDGADQFFLNLNTPEDYANAIEQFGRDR